MLEKCGGEIRRCRLKKKNYFSMHLDSLGNHVYSYLESRLTRTGRVSVSAVMICVCTVKPVVAGRICKQEGKWCDEGSR